MGYGLSAWRIAWPIEGPNSIELQYEVLPLTVPNWAQSLMDRIIGRPWMGYIVLDNVKPNWAIIRPEIEWAGHLAGLMWTLLTGQFSEGQNL
jgi:hypothetical protein